MKQFGKRDCKFQKRWDFAGSQVDTRRVVVGIFARANGRTAGGVTRPPGMVGVGAGIGDIASAPVS